MMFINPIEILELQDVEHLNIDSSIIKKAKRKLFADIDLSEDGHFDYKGLKLTKTDCETAIGEIENGEKKDFFCHLSSNKNLNNFLVNGDEKLFSDFTHEGIYKLQDFVNFISPYYAFMFNRSILKAFKNNNLELLHSILRTQTLINSSNLSTAFKSLSNEIQVRINEIDKITQEIKNEETKYTEDNIEEVIQIIENYFHVPILNLLPPYFQSQLNKIANSLNYLSIAVWNEFTSPLIPMKILESVLNLNLESVSKPTFQKNHLIYQNKYQEQKEQENNAPVLKQWAELLTQLHEISEKIDSKVLKPKQAEKSINGINIVDLNNLGCFADELRISISFTLRSISISIWNTYNETEIAIKIINTALTITLNDETRSKLLADIKKLKDLEKEREIQGEPINSVPSLKLVNGCGTTIYGKTLYFVIFGIPILPIARFNCESTYNGYRFFGKLKLHKWQKYWKVGLPLGILIWITIGVIMDNNSSRNNYTENYSTSSNNNDYSTSNDNSTSPEYSTPVKSESLYKGNKLANGTSPFDECFGKGIYSGHAWIKFDNSNASDAIVSLVNVYSGKVIRNEYIKSGTNYKMSKVPTGTYYIKVYYGNDWNPTKTNICGTLGAFDNDESFSKSDNQNDYIEITNTTTSYSTWTITLYSVDNGNMSTQPSNESDFFKN